MTTESIVPYSFVPGTKAKAQEVNANFTSVASAIQADKEYVTQKVEEINASIEDISADLTNQIAEINTALDTKANIDASNANLASTTVKGYTIFGTNSTTISGTRPAVVVKVYYSGPNWYRIWSDGWLEQGGIHLELNSADTETTITFMKPFVSSGYSFQYSSRVRTETSVTYNTKYDVGSYIEAEHTHIKIKVRNSLQRLSWRASGYILPSELED